MIEDIANDEMRKTVALFYTGDGMTVDGIAAEMGVAVSTVTTRLNRFRSRYRKIIIKRILELRDEE